MKLGVVVILIGLAWCARAHLLRPKPVELPPAVTYHEPAPTVLVLPAVAEEGTSVSYTIWSPWQGGQRWGQPKEYTMANGEWVETAPWPSLESHPYEADKRQGGN